MGKALFSSDRAGKQNLYIKRLEKNSSKVEESLMVKEIMLLQYGPERLYSFY